MENTGKNTGCCSHGNVFETLMNIDAIGNDLKIHGGLGGCGKGGQSPLRVSDGGPMFVSKYRYRRKM